MSLNKDCDIQTFANAFGEVVGDTDTLLIANVFRTLRLMDPGETLRVRRCDIKVRSTDILLLPY